jgi:basic membrane protein A
MQRRFLLVFLALAGCKKSPDAKEANDPLQRNTGQRNTGLMVGLVTDIGGRGDQSFNDSALRGLESWAAASQFQGGRYQPLAPDARAATIPADLRTRISPIPVKPLVLQSKVQEDYQPNLQLVVDQGSDLVIGVGFALENGIEAVAKQNPSAKFLLIDSPLLDSTGKPFTAPNVRSVVFKEHEGSFLAGSLAGLVGKTAVGFVGGMDIPLIKRFEVGFKAGVRTTNAEAKVLVHYTGTFDNVQHGKQAAVDLISKGCEVLFHAAGSDGTGVIQAVKEARAAGKTVYVIGVDSDQAHLAPDAVLTSMVKRVDLAVWQAIKDLDDHSFNGGNVVMGLKEGGVTLAEVRIEFEGKADALVRVQALRRDIVEGRTVVPANEQELSTFLSQTRSNERPF